MTQQIRIFGQEVTLETMRVAVVAINEGFSVTVQAVLNDEDVLCAHTVARAKASAEEATSEMIPQAVSAVRAWMDSHAEVDA